LHGNEHHIPLLLQIAPVANEQFRNEQAQE